MNREKILKASKIIRDSQYLTAFTGAGISMESGIPPFRGPMGLWSKYDPSLFDISYFYKHPEKSWRLIRDIFFETFKDAKPNRAHLVLARLEEEGILKTLITQNIDNLHFLAGSRQVIEYHGNSRELRCIECGEKTTATTEILESLPPRCNCGGILKPEFIFFGEGIPEETVRRSEEAVRKTDAMLVIGTTGEVFPAGMIPEAAYSKGASIIEINPEPSNYTYRITDVFIREKAARVMGILYEEL